MSGHATTVDIDDLARRATSAAQTWAPGCRIEAVEPLTGGESSLTYSCRVKGGAPEPRELVLKVAPPGLAPVRNRDVARQARLMRALAGAVDVRVPTVFFEDDGDPPDVSPFHAMNLVEGECLEPLLDQPASDVMPFVGPRAFAAAAMLAALHRVDPSRVLSREPEMSLADEVARCVRRAFSTVDEHLSARHLEAEALLLAKMPTMMPAVICHGDYRLGNMLCSRGEVAAIIDWEIWSLSDPRLDLAWFVFFTDDAVHPMITNHGESGMPSSDALLAAYANASGREVSDLEWFHCLIRYKEAAATALLQKRLVKRGGTAPGSETWPTAIPGLTAECIARLERL